MSLLVFPIECCYLLIDASAINELYMEQLTPINVFSPFQQFYEGSMNSTPYDHFCICEQAKNIIPYSEKYCEPYKTLQIHDYWNCICSLEQVRKEVKRRIRKSPQLEIEEKVLDILKKILSNELHPEYFMRKAPEKDRNYSLKRSSKYIGISMNGNNWQAMINNGFGKKYIGTYLTEKEAAIVYDFYSFALHDWNHQTNFNYSLETVQEMIQNYFENDKVLTPIPFIDKA